LQCWLCRQFFAIPIDLERAPADHGADDPDVEAEITRLAEQYRQGGIRRLVFIVDSRSRVFRDERFPYGGDLGVVRCRRGILALIATGRAKAL
jgi:hypothetical protein